MPKVLEPIPCAQCGVPMDPFTASQTMRGAWICPGCDQAFRWQAHAAEQARLHAANKATGTAIAAAGVGLGMTAMIIAAGALLAFGIVGYFFYKIFIEPGRMPFFV